MSFICSPFHYANRLQKGSWIGLLLILFAALPFSPAAAHEYYLMPGSFSIEEGEKVGIAHKNGMRFKGNTYPWISRWNVRSEAWREGVGGDVRGKDGDLPALTLQMALSGLVTIIHESSISDLTFKDWEKFISYLEEEGLEPIAERHLAKGGSKDEIREIYARFAKTLINVGSPATGSDNVTGLTIELVALENPAALQSGASLPVQLLFDGKPLQGAMVKVFVGENTDVAHQLVTDKNGKVAVPDGGAGPYLLNAVHMIEPRTDAEIAKDADWQSFWASLTFAR